MHGWGSAAFSQLSQPALLLSSSAVKMVIIVNGHFSLESDACKWTLREQLHDADPFWGSTVAPEQTLRVESPQFLFCCTTGSEGLSFFQPSWQYLQAKKTKGYKIGINTFWTWRNPLLVQSYLQSVQEKCGISFLKTPELPTLSLEGLSLPSLRGEDQSCRIHS